MLAGAREAARSRLRVGRARRGQRLSRSGAWLWSSCAGAWRQSRSRTAAAAVASEHSSASTADAPARPQGRRRRARFLARYVAARRPRAAARPGRRHRRRGAGLRHAARRRRRRLAALRHDLELDQGQPPASRRAALVPLAATAAWRTPRRPPTPTWTPARALLVASCRFKQPGLQQEAVRLGKAILRTRPPPFQGRRCWWPDHGRVKHPVTLNPSYFSPATFAALAPRPATAAGAACRRARARSPTY